MHLSTKIIFYTLLCLTPCSQAMRLGIEAPTVQKVTQALKNYRWANRSIAAGGIAMLGGLLAESSENKTLKKTGLWIALTGAALISGGSTARTILNGRYGSAKQLALLLKHLK